MRIRKKITLFFILSYIIIFLISVFLIYYSQYSLIIHNSISNIEFYIDHVFKHIKKDYSILNSNELQLTHFEKYFQNFSLENNWKIQLINKKNEHTLLIKKIFKKLESLQKNNKKTNFYYVHKNIIQYFIAWEPDINHCILITQPINKYFLPLYRNIIAFGLILIFAFIFLLILSYLFVNKYLKQIFRFHQFIKEQKIITKNIEEKHQDELTDLFHTIKQKFQEYKNWKKLIYEEIEDVFIKFKKLETLIKNHINKLVMIKDDNHNQTNNLSETENTVKQKRGLADKTMTSLVEFDLQMNRITDSINDQVANIQEFSASIEEMVAQINTVKEQIFKANEISKNLSALGHNSGALVNNSIEGIKEIEKTSKQISEIIKIIYNIANQTNLLALNAAIEAAHAGAAGKGFAVVADQIRELAEDSGQSAKNITYILTQTLEMIKNAVQSSEKVGIAINAIINDVINIDKINTEISTAMEEQVSGTNDILNTTKNLMENSTNIKSTFQNQKSNKNQIQNMINQWQEINIRRDDTDSTNVFDRENLKYTSHELDNLIKIIIEKQETLKYKLNS